MSDSENALASAVPNYEDLDRRLQALTIGGGPPGVALGVLTQTGVATCAAGTARAGSGRPLTSETCFPIGCLIKPLLSLACLGAFARGELDIDVPVEEYLPELCRNSNITLRHLLSHMGGYVEPGLETRWTLTWDQFVEFFAQRRQILPPGYVWSYSQTGHAIVAEIIARISRRDAVTAVDELVFRPLGIKIGERGLMASAHLNSGQRGRYDPVKLPSNRFYSSSISDLALSVGDLAKIAGVFGGPLCPDGVSDETYQLFSRKMITIPATSGGALKEATPKEYGLGLGIYNYSVGHNGSLVGTTCGVRFDYRAGIGIAVGMNAWTPGLRDRLIREVLAEVTGNRHQRSVPRCRLTQPLDHFRGTYQSLGLGGERLSVNVTRQGVELRGEGDPPSTFAVLSVDSEGWLNVADPKPLHLAIGLGVDASSGRRYVLNGAIAHIEE